MKNSNSKRKLSNYAISLLPNAQRNKILSKRAERDKVAAQDQSISCARLQPHHQGVVFVN
jgi:hypothetical protein